MSEEKISSLTLCNALKEKDLICSLEENEKLHCDLLSNIEKFNKFSPRNVEKRIKRREIKINDLCQANDVLKKQLQDLSKKQNSLSIENDTLSDLNNKLDVAIEAKSKAQKMKSYYKHLSMKKMSSPFCSFEEQIKDLQNYVKVLETEKLETEERLKVFMDKEILTKENGRYTDDVRAVYQDLVCMGVGINNVEKIVRTVIENLMKLKVESLPKATFSRMMFLEARHLSQIQVCESIIDSDQLNTLHSDGTSKFGQHYETYDMSLSSGKKLVLGMREVGAGNALSQFDCLKEIVSEICESDDFKSKQIFSSIRNTMSDRHIVQKKVVGGLQSFYLA